MKQLTHEQIDRLTPELREKYFKQLKKVKRNRKILAGVIAFVVVAVVAAALSMTVLFNITSIKVKQAGKFYSEQEIISASGLDNGDNMIRTNFKTASKRIETMLPYVLEARIDKSLSGAVTITIKDDKASMIFSVKNGYAIADADGKVLEIFAKEPENSKLMVLKTGQELTAKPGEYIGFKDENEQSLYETICEALKKAKLYNKTTGIDISSPANIKIEYQHRLRIKIGDISDIDTKLTAAVKTIAMEDESDPNLIGEVNVMTPKKVYVNPLDSLDETEKAEPVEEKTTAATEDTTEEDAEDVTDEDSSESDENIGEETQEDEGSEETDEEETTVENEENGSEDDGYSDEEE